MSSLRVMVVDDSVLLREGICRILEDADIEVVAQLGDATTLEAVVEELAPDLVVLDIRMPPTNTTEGLEAAVSLRKTHPGCAVLLLSQYVETRYALELIADGAASVGYLLKDRIVDVDQFLAALRRVAVGDTAIDAEVVTRLVGRERRDNPIEQLSVREREVLSLMAEGRDNTEVATTLSLNPRTVESHVSNIFAKLGLLPETEGHRRVRAVLTYLESAPA